MGKLSAAKEREYQKEYNKQSRRINRYYKTLQERGYAFDEFRPVEKKEYVTKKDIEKLKNITAKKILEKSYYTNEWGEVESGPEAHKRIAQEKRREALEQEIPEDKEMLFNRLTEMLEGFNAYMRYGSNIKGERVQQANDRLYGYLIYAWNQNNEGVINTVANNYSRLVEIVSHVQDYIIIQGEMTEFERTVIGETMSLEENLQATEDYNDSMALPDEELDDYDILDEE